MSAPTKAVPRLARVNVPAAGFDLPVVAYGTGTALYQRDVSKEVSIAAEAGHRFFDLAEMYKNTQYAGNGLRPHLTSGESGIKRSDLIILTKIGEGQPQAYKALQEEVKALNLLIKDESTTPNPVFDVVLSHYPPRADKAKGRPSNLQVWRELERAVDDGLTRSIGVSNWLAEDIETLYADADAEGGGIKHPIAFNQIEFHPLIASSPQYKALLPLCKEKGIKIMTYSPLVPLTRNLLPEMPKLKEAIDNAVAAKSGRTQTSVLLKYAHQMTNDGIIVTTSSKPERTAEYLSMFASEKSGQEGTPGAEDLLSQAELDAITEAAGQYRSVKAWMEEWW
ncbi:hypothetical protein CF326_g1543 [Tilletia indica]|nr:hypothetical protein CF326_g1543 [Tilletia indica]